MIVSTLVRHRITVIIAVFYFAVMAVNVLELAAGVDSAREHKVILVAMSAWLPLWWLVHHL